MTYNVFSGTLNATQSINQWVSAMAEPSDSTNTATIDLYLICQFAVVTSAWQETD